MESIETIIVELTDPALANVVISDFSATGRILNDDRATISIGDYSKLEGSTPFLVPIVLSAALDSSVNIQVIYSDISTDSDDYGTLTNPTTITFTGTAGEIQLFSIPVVSDSIVELDETLSVSISIPSNPHPAFLSISDDTALVTIRNDDSCIVEITRTLDFVDEGNPNPTISYDFDVTLSKSIDVSITIDILCSDRSATLNSDYSQVTPNQLIVSTAGIHSVTVPIIPDTNVELDETFELSLSVNTQGRSIILVDTPAVGKIKDDDSATISLSYSSPVIETDGNVAFVIQATLSASVDGTVSFDYLTQDLSLPSLFMEIPKWNLMKIFDSLLQIYNCYMGIS